MIDPKTIGRHQLVTIPAGQRTELVRFLGTTHGTLRVQRLGTRKELTIDPSQVIAVQETRQ